MLPLPCLGASHLYSASRLFWSPPVVTACVCDLCRVRVLVRLSHPRPPDRSQHGCTVGVLPGPTRVLPMPRQCGIGRRAPTRAVLSCAALWCLVVRRPRRRVDCLVLTFCSVSSRRKLQEIAQQFRPKMRKHQKIGPQRSHSALQASVFIFCVFNFLFSCFLAFSILLRKNCFFIFHVSMFFHLFLHVPWIVMLRETCLISSHFDQSAASLCFGSGISAQRRNTCSKTLKPCSYEYLNLNTLRLLKSESKCPLPRGNVSGCGSMPMCQLFWVVCFCLSVAFVFVFAFCRCCVFDF